METTSFLDSGSFQLILLAAFLIPAILFLVTEFTILRRIKPENRLLQPGWVWLQIIPFLGQLWQFVVVARIASSIQKEWRAGGEESVLGISHEAAQDVTRSKPTLIIGMVYCTLNAIVVFMNLVFRGTGGDSLVMVQGFLAIASIVCWVFYWIALAGWARRLKQKMEPGV